MSTFGICDNILTYYPIKIFIPGSPSNIGVVMFGLGVIYVTMSLVTIIFIKSQEIKASKDDTYAEGAVSNIFPVFVYVLWLSALASIMSGVIVCLVPFEPIDENSMLSSLCYALVSALQHGVIEGIAFLLMQKGCGQYAARVASIWTLVWSIVVFLVTFGIYLKQGTIGDILEIILDIGIFIFYMCLWLAPQSILFRRPALYIYARFWAYFRLAAIIIKILFFFQDTESVAGCGYVFATLLLFAIFQPLTSYWTLLQDSDWWQGIDINQGGRHGSYEDIRSPLLGTDISLSSAQSLAHTMDHIRYEKRVKMINFANIKVDQTKHLGAGSFSKVVKGFYQKKECAVKMIYTYDLTANVIRRIAAEASILSSIKHPNVVHIYGVSVLPPSVCLILEVCHFGSLSDIIRGYGYDWNPACKKPNPMVLCHTDRIQLALGCARGLAAIHAYDDSLCHRDIKSFNFLVDYQFNVKIADLELGGDNIVKEMSVGMSSHHSMSAAEGLPVEEFLANWMAPELLHGRSYTQLSDVYALAVVFWEIIAGALPFENHTQAEIRSKLRSGYRHALPVEYMNTPYGNLIVRGWSEHVEDRPTSAEIVNELEVMLQDVCYRVISDTELNIDTSPVIDHYNRWKLSSISSMNNNSSIATPARSSMIGNFSPFASKSPSLSLPLQTPSYIFDILGAIQEHRGWIALENTSQPWAVFTVASPHVLVYNTTSWNYLFGLQNDQDNLSIRSFRDFTMNIPSPRLNQKPIVATSSKPRWKLWSSSSSSKSDVNRYPSRESEGSLHSVNQVIFESTMHQSNQRSTASSIASSIYNSLSFSRTTDSRSKGNSHMTGGASYHQVNELINETYHHSATTFLNQLQDHNEGHGIVPLTRKLGRTVDSFLCSLHAYGIYPRSPSPTSSSKHGNIDTRPVYFAILFHELKHQASMAKTSTTNTETSSTTAIPIAPMHHKVASDSSSFDIHASLEQSYWPDSHPEPKSQSSSFGSILSILSQSPSLSLSGNEQGSTSAGSGILDNIMKYSSLKKKTALLNPKDFEIEEESWVE